MNIHEALLIIPRSLFSLLTLFIISKLIGKKQVSELSLFDYVIGISIGNFTAEMTMNLENQYTNGIVAIFTFGIISWFVSKITMKSIILRRFLIGTPTIIIQDGKILESSMKKLNIDINDLLEQCRTNGTFDISEIEYAIMEVNGKISILLKKDYQQPTNKDMNLKLPNQGLVANIIIDGKIMKNNLNNMNKTEEWLFHELNIKGINLNDILLATLDNQEKVTFYKRNYQLVPKKILE
jgi:uncharacterized membrane protein YcaP (DUF421 family)